MNRVILIGRQTKDANYSISSSGTAVARTTLAVDRRGSNNEADFINLIAFKQTADFLNKYGRKGTKWVVEGHINTGSYERNGERVYTTDVVIDHLEFGESKAAKDNNAGNNTEPAPAAESDFMDIPDNIEDELPFV